MSMMAADEKINSSKIPCLRDGARDAADRIKVTQSQVCLLEARLFLARAIGKSAEYVMAHPEVVPAPAQWEAFEDMVARRERREPVAYILGEKEFYSLAFKVDRRALIPRPETEGVVDAALDMFPGPGGLSVLEIGVGSGIISICLAKHRPEWRITATDISREALALAAENAGIHHVEKRISLVHADLFPPGDEKFDLIVSNPPYIPSDGAGLSPDITRYEPEQALYGGVDGLEALRRITAGLSARLAPGGGVALETGHGQAGRALDMLKDTGLFGSCGAILDIQGIERVVWARG